MLIKTHQFRHKVKGKGYSPSGSSWLQALTIIKWIFTTFLIASNPLCKSLLLANYHILFPRSANYVFIFQIGSSDVIYGPQVKWPAVSPPTLWRHTASWLCSQDPVSLLYQRESWEPVEIYLPVLLEEKFKMAAIEQFSIWEFFTDHYPQSWDFGSEMPAFFHLCWTSRRICLQSSSARR